MPSAVGSGLYSSSLVKSVSLPLLFNRTFSVNIATCFRVCSLRRSYSGPSLIAISLRPSRIVLRSSCCFLSSAFVETDTNLATLPAFRPKKLPVALVTAVAPRAALRRRPRDMSTSMASKGSFPGLPDPRPRMKTTTMATKAINAAIPPTRPPISNGDHPVATSPLAAVSVPPPAPPPVPALVPALVPAAEPVPVSDK